MRQFVVPQFIDVEDKIFGPITTRQFLIVLVAGLILFICYKLADITLFIFLVVVIGGSATILAFLKVNGQGFHYFLLNIVQTLRRPSLRIWNKIYTKSQLLEYIKIGQVEAPEIIAPVQRISYNRIRDLSLTVNTGGYFNPEE
ncbi:MAG: hypothetical protein A2261_00410 [Candidatus Magasanikbacteria bacterium RIFOXYA2_FULL_44_8]|uniref:PrgI family protein n=1 Tax=Candidatus Magasanikbacteria bacterium RIFOXYA2_FULL_44_8 TaxID=1798696 RepID=A0A1F6NLC0_9BACT|nr:MAG: hypothetical protein A2261_00410 [Candidatus Magasanikbacteria bacterium RIFOXYA2_FULL_44_8]